MHKYATREEDKNEKLGRNASLFLAGTMMVSMAACGGEKKIKQKRYDSAAKVEITSQEDLADLTIGVQSGTTGDLTCSDIVKEDSQMQRFPERSGGSSALKAGKLDCVVIDSQPAAKFVEA